MGRLVRAFFVVALAAGLAAGLTGGRAHGRSLVVFNVDDTNDRVDATPGDTICRTSRDTCTLRAAVMEANALQLRIGGSLPEYRDVVIQLGAGTYSLTRAPSTPTSGVDGDLFLVARRSPGAPDGTVTITGRGAAMTTIRSTVDDRVLTAQARTLVQNLTITGGRAVTRTLDRAGGGIQAIDSLVLRGVAVTGNAALAGGGIASQGPLFVEDSRITDNDGGGIWQIGSTLSVRRSTVAGNQSAGVHYQPTVPITGDALQILESIVADNTAMRRFGAGVAVCCGNPVSPPVRAYIADSTIRDNVGTDGGGIVANPANLTVVRTLIAGNTAVSAGGFFAAEGHFHLENVTLSGNAAENTGGIYAAGPGSLRAVTFAENSAPGTSGLRSFPGTGGAEAEATIFGDAAASCAPGSGLTSLGFNVARDSSCPLGMASDVSRVDPRLGPLADNGGGSLTHALLDGSPALDRYGSVTCPANDQRYRRRPAGPACDSGAYEHNGEVITPTIPRLPAPRYDIPGGIGTLVPFPSFTPVTRSLRGGDYRPCVPGRRLRAGIAGGFYKVGDGQLVSRSVLIFRRDAQRRVQLGNLLFLLDRQAGQVLALLAPTKGPLALFDVDRVHYGPKSVRARLHLTAGAARVLNRLLGLHGFRAGMDCGQLTLSLSIGRDPGPLRPVPPLPPPQPPAPPPTTTTTTTTTTTQQTFTLGAVVDPGDGGSISSDPEGISCPSDCSESYAAGTSVKLKAKPADGFEFKEWDGSCGGSDESCTVTLDQNRSVTARFKKKESSKPQCSDGKDNDGDQAIDLQDPQCNGPNDDNEAK